MPIKQRHDGGALVSTATWVLPSKVGLGVLLAVALLFAVADSRVVAIGFMAPILVLLIVDAAVSLSGLRARDLRVRAVRTAGTGDEPLTVMFEAQPSRFPLSVALASISALAAPSSLMPFPADGDQLMLEDCPDHPSTSNHLRTYAICSWLGLARASQWQVRQTTPLYF